MIRHVDHNEQSRSSVLAPARIWRQLRRPQGISASRRHAYDSLRAIANRMSRRKRRPAASRKRSLSDPVGSVGRRDRRRHELPKRHLRQSPTSGRTGPKNDLGFIFSPISYPPSRPFHIHPGHSGSRSATGCRVVRTCPAGRLRSTDSRWPQDGYIVVLSH
jgi:hypothetical protein